jgi:hypothetical protein
MKILVCVVYNFNFGETIFVFVVVSEPESPAARVDAPSHIPITPHYYWKIRFIFRSQNIFTKSSWWFLLAEVATEYLKTFCPMYFHVLVFFCMAQQPLAGQGHLIIEASQSHTDTQHSVWLLWTSDQPNAETSTWQHTTLTRDGRACPCGDSNPQSQQASGRRPTP